jgi:hypothetical protein
MSASALVTTAQSREFGHTHESASKKMNDPVDVGAMYARERVFSVFKLFYVWGIDVPKEFGFGYANTEEAGVVRKNLNMAKLLEAPGKFLENMNRLRERTIDLIKDPSFKGAYEWIRSANMMINPIYDGGFDFTNKAGLIKFDPGTLHVAKGVNASAMVFGFGTNVIHDAMDIASNRVNDKEVKGELREYYRQVGMSTLLKTAYDISLLALGVLTVLATFFAVVIPGALFVAFSASSVVAHIAKFFYENIGEGIKPATDAVKKFETNKGKV